jgi:hypothetical protein
VLSELVEPAPPPPAPIAQTLNETVPPGIVYDVPVVKTVLA